MADKSAASVIAALNTVYQPTLCAFEQFHRQEHRFEVKYRYKKLQKRFDKLVHCARCWRRALLNRIERLGGDADSTISGVDVADDIMSAYCNTQTALDAIYDAIQRAIGVAKSADDESANDHVTHTILMHLQYEVDHKRSKVEAWLRQVEDLGPNYALNIIG
jgi:hypothetical protein